MTPAKTVAQLIAEYRARAPARRTASVLNNPLLVDECGASHDGVVTVKNEPEAKPISELGGATKVLGRSIIRIPEMRRTRG